MKSFIHHSLRLLAGLAAAAGGYVQAQVFSDIGAGLQPVTDGYVAWGDYDNDGRLDLLLTGQATIGRICQVWRNTGTGFTNVNPNLPGIYSSSATWADYDNDGRLDFMVTGFNNSDSITSLLWRNTVSGFSNVSGVLPTSLVASVAWGDFDGEGRLDILVGGANFLIGSVSQVWRNNGNAFVNINAGLPGVSASSVTAADYDNDGRRDLLISGSTGAGYITQVWRNTGGGFTNLNAGLPGVTFASVAWGDYDNDGRVDILMTGTTNGNGSGAISRIYRNTSGGFVNLGTALPGVMDGSVAWGDYDNDGRLDFLLTGTTNGSFSGGIAQAWRNTGSGFTNLNAVLPGLSASSVAWGDYDNDGRLDMLLTGADAAGGYTSQIWRNTSGATNTPPAPPTGLAAVAAGNAVILSWNPASDAQTPAVALSYNIRIGTTPGGSEVLPAMSASTGVRRLPQAGNAQAKLLFKGVIGTTYYWSVQAVDSAFAGSAFSSEGSFALHGALGLPGSTNAVSGDLNGDGLVSQSELETVLSNYFPTSPFLKITNVAGLGGTNVTFALTNSLEGAFSVEYSTNLANWYFLGPATPRYFFTDTNTPAGPQRYYRLRWP